MSFHHFGVKVSNYVTNINGQLKFLLIIDQFDSILQVQWLNWQKKKPKFKCSINKIDKI